MRKDVFFASSCPHRVFDPARSFRFSRDGFFCYNERPGFPFSGSPDSPAQKGSSAVRDRFRRPPAGHSGDPDALRPHSSVFSAKFLQLFPQTNLSVNGISLLAFPTFVFCFGRTVAMAYLKKPFRQALPRMGRTLLRCLAAFYRATGAAYRVLRERKPLGAGTLRNIFLLNDIPGWSEFLIAFALLMLAAIVLFPLLRQITCRRWLWLPLSVPCLLGCFLPYGRIILPQLALLVGGKDRCSDRAIFSFLSGGRSLYEREFSGTARHGRRSAGFQRRRPCLVCSPRSARTFSAPLGVDSPALLCHRPADGAISRPMPSARRKILAARGRSAADAFPFRRRVSVLSDSQQSGAVYAGGGGMAPQLSRKGPWP